MAAFRAATRAARPCFWRSFAGLSPASSSSSSSRLSAMCFSSSVDPPSVSGAGDGGEGGVVVSIDRSGLVSRAEHSHDISRRGEESAMSKHISALIRFRGGPISVAEYMGEVLTNPNAGVYMNQDVFGAKGDFVTSPDSSQMFGEMLGVWSMLLWEQMGKPKNLAIVELGPGRGTLLADLLRLQVDLEIRRQGRCVHALLEGSTAKFQSFARSLSIHLVECSPTLRKVQETALLFASDAGIPISWHMELEQVPRGVPCIIFAHEFFDALPIHQFQKTSRGWCEKLVDVSDARGEFRFVLSPRPTTASTLYLERRLRTVAERERSNLVHVEVCPEAVKLTSEIARRVAEDGGGALVIDYGDDNVTTDSLQAIRKHRFSHVLEDPGSADLSAYVDFAAIRQAVEDTGVGASVYGPVTQSTFLGSLGINFRFEKLMNAVASDAQRESLQLGYWTLVGEGLPPWLEDDDDEAKAPIGMGARYKALAITQSGLGQPIGFY